MIILKKNWIMIEIIEAQAQVTQVFIGVPTPDYDIHKSVFYTHNFFHKIMKEDGSAVAKCMVCWEKNKEKNVSRRLLKGSLMPSIPILQRSEGN